MGDMEQMGQMQRWAGVGGVQVGEITEVGELEGERFLFCKNGEKEQMKTETTFPLTLYGHHHNI